MAWTDPDAGRTRSRDELLEHVLRRGGRIRRRRRTAAALAGACALVLPATAFVATELGRDRSLNVTATGTAATGSPAAGLAPTQAPPADLATTTSLAAIEPGQQAPATTLPAEVPRGEAPAGRVPQTTSVTTVPPADAPVVRAAPSSPSAPSTPGSGNAAGPPAVTAPTTAPPTADRPLEACPASEVRVTVVTEKGVYAPGETVRWTSTLENRSSSACLVSSRAFFRVEDAAGRNVAQIAHTADFRMPVKAEPGKTFTAGFMWDQRDCSSSPCAQVPAATYTVVADWTEGGPYSGRGTFRIGP